MNLFNLSAILLLIVFVTDQTSAQNEVSSDKSRYKAYDKLFIKPKSTFNEKYKKVYMSNAVAQIFKNNTNINVCVNHVINIEDDILEGHDSIYKNTRRITEYLLSTLSKYTPLKFYITSVNCDLKIDFNRPVSGDAVGYTVFSVKDHKPHADILIDHDQIKNLAYSKNLSFLKAYMRVLMKEIIHGLGVGKNEEDFNIIIGSVNESARPSLLTKRQVYNLRSIYGTRGGSTGNGGSRNKPSKSTTRRRTKPTKPSTTPKPSQTKPKE